MIARAVLIAMFLTALAPPQSSPAPHFVLLHVRTDVYGVAGTGTIAIDRLTGRFARNFLAGPASEGEGWDGERAWRSDATGMGRIQGNAGERAEILGWSAALVRALGSSPARVVVSSGRDRDTLSFDRYQTRDGLSVPGRIVSQSSQNGAWTAVVQQVDTQSSLPAQAFDPAPAPRDSVLASLTRIPVSMAAGSPQLDVSVNGVRLSFLLDTGGQNVITKHAAALAGLQPVGHGIVRGGGGGTVPIQYAFAQSVRVGSAELRHQPFIVLPTGSFGADGIVGYELLARFAARLDMTHGTLELAPSASTFGPRVDHVPFQYFDRQPQVGGSLDAIDGPFTIDTGSSLTAAVQAGVVRTHNLVSSLHATVATYAQDVGGRYPIYLVRARELKLGPAGVRDPLLDLLTRIDASDDPAIVANIGDGLLRRWIIVFDYAHQSLDLRPGGDPSGNVFHDRSGMLLRTRANSLVVDLVFSGTPASEAGIAAGEQINAVDGRPVAARDLTSVRDLLRGTPGTRVRILLGNGSTYAFVLRRYL
jgi:hypothetical protein